jgi:hypothetical protein
MTSNSLLSVPIAANSTTQGNTVDNGDKQLFDLLDPLSPQTDVQTACSWELAVREADRELVLGGNDKEPSNPNNSFQTTLFDCDRSSAHETSYAGVNQVPKMQLFTTSQGEMPVVSDFGPRDKISSWQDESHMLQDCDKYEGDNSDQNTMNFQVAENQEQSCNVTVPLVDTGIKKEQSSFIAMQQEQKLPKAINNIVESNCSEQYPANSPLKVNELEPFETQTPETPVSDLQHDNEDFQTQDENVKVEDTAGETANISSDVTVGAGGEQLQESLSKNTKISDQDQMEVCNCESVPVCDIDTCVANSHPIKSDANSESISCPLSSCPPVQNENISESEDVKSSQNSEEADESVKGIFQADEADFSATKETIESPEPNDSKESSQYTDENQFNESSFAGPTASPSMQSTAVHVDEHDQVNPDRQTNHNDQIAMETEDSWDSLFDEKGNALDSKLMDELTKAVGKVKVQKPQFDYYNYQPKDPDIDEESFGHLIEIYDFST